MRLPPLLLLLALAAAPVAAQQATAADATALLRRARAARFQQDSALEAYQAIVRQRMSAGLGLARGMGVAGAIAGLDAVAVGRERLAARYESVARVGWHREHGAWAEVLGLRAVVPIVGETTPDYSDADEDAALVLPYYPGRDHLWPMDELRQAFSRAEDWIEHPFGTGADSVYAFSIGDSLQFQFPNGERLLLVELRVQPKRPDSRLVVGSLWVDARTGHLVRAAYRPSVPMDLWPLFSAELSTEDQRRVGKFGPYRGLVREIIVEYGRYDRFWLPRVRIASAEGTASGARVTISITQTFSYERVEAGVTRPPLASVPPAQVDPRTGRVRRPRWYGVEQRSHRCRPRGDSSDRWSPDSLQHDDGLSVMYAEGIRFRVLVPCNPRDLANADVLPGSIYDEGEELFPEVNLEALRNDVQQAFAMSRQAEWEPQPWLVTYGWRSGLVRYNRVEGLSVGARAERELGSGYSVQGTGRIGVADLEPGIELAGSRASTNSALGAGLYHRLVAAGDWGSPFGVGASVNALLFGRDDGFYFRATGVELVGRTKPALYGLTMDWRVFAERQRTAAVGTHASIPNLLHGQSFQPNIPALEGNWLGGATFLHVSAGSDMRGTRATMVARVEGALHEESRTGYGRYSAETTIAQGLGDAWSALLTLGGGTSTGTLSPQRSWFLGGAHTVRGHRAGALAGDAFWLARGELSVGHPMVRPAFFADAGWAGPRTEWGSAAQPLTGIGVGASILDGMLRLDVSRGLSHDRRFRIDFYFDPR